MEIEVITIFAASFSAFMLGVYLLSSHYDRQQRRRDEENNRKANFDWKYHNEYNKKVFGDDFL